MTRAADLMRLQNADARIAADRGEVAGVEAALRGDPELDRQLAHTRRATEQSASVSAELASTEQELATLERRVKTLDRTLYGGTVRNPNELLEMQRELEFLRGQIGAVEERVLERIDADEAAAAEAAHARTTVEELERRRSDQEEPRRRRLEELQSRLARETLARDETAASIPAADLALYGRVATRHQPAVVGIKGDACGGCHLPLSNEERRAVRAGDTIVQCSNCDRILVP